MTDVEIKESKKVKEKYGKMPLWSNVQPYFHIFRILTFFYTASDKLVKVKSRIFIGGTKLPPRRTGLPSASRLLSIITGLSLKRKFFTGNLIFPFSM